MIRSNFKLNSFSAQKKTDRKTTIMHLSCNSKNLKLMTCGSCDSMECQSHLSRLFPRGRFDCTLLSSGTTTWHIKAHLMQRKNAISFRKVISVNNQMPISHTNPEIKDKLCDLFGHFSHRMSCNPRGPSPRLLKLTLP